MRLNTLNAALWRIGTATLDLSLWQADQRGMF